MKFKFQRNKLVSSHSVSGYTETEAVHKGRPESFQPQTVLVLYRQWLEFGGTALVMFT